jgi:hypothetical protein
MESPMPVSTANTLLSRRGWSDIGGEISHNDMDETYPDWLAAAKAAIAIGSCR